MLSLDATANVEALEALLTSQQEVFQGKVFLEVTERVPWGVLSRVAAMIQEAGGEVGDARPPNAVLSAKGETVIVARTVRSGGRVEATGSAIILGDVNAGAEIIAGDDIIVLGTLRGLAHAGASGNEKAFIWAQRILSPQLRIAGALAQAGESSPEASGPEVAHLHEEQIILRPWER